MSIPSGFPNPAQTVSGPQVDGVPRLEIVMGASRESFLVSNLLHHAADGAIEVDDLKAHIDNFSQGGLRVI